MKRTLLLIFATLFIWACDQVEKTDDTNSEGMNELERFEEKMTKESEIKKADKYNSETSMEDMNKEKDTMKDSQN